MFVKVHKPVNTPCVCDNKDRCRALVEYLLKESLEDKPYYDTLQTFHLDLVLIIIIRFLLKFIEYRFMYDTAFFSTHRLSSSVPSW